MDLDAQQKEAVETTSSRALVLAGAGSGKTRVLTERVAWLLETQKVSPYEILAVTFTRKAAQELQDRLDGRVGGARHITCGTLHSVALGFLRRFGELFGLKPNNLTVYREWEEGYLLKEVATDLGVYKGKQWKIPKAEIISALDRYYQEGVFPREDERTYKVCAAFIDRCLENNALTYGLLLNYLNGLLPQIRAHLGFRHILVDEVQDIDRLQWHILNCFMDLCGASLFVAGDIDQSIYGWRGAVPEYLIMHQDSFDIYRIENNYRSNHEIVEAANRLIENNQMRISRTMRATQIESSPVIGIQKDMDSTTFAQYLSYVWPRWAKDGMAVLARNHWVLDKLAEALDRANVPYVKIGRTSKLIGSPEFQRVHAFLKLRVNPFDNFSFLLIRELLGISRAEYNQIRLRASQQGKSHFLVWIQNPNPSDIRIWFLSTNLPMKETVTDLFELVKAFNVPEYEAIREFIEDAQFLSLPKYLDWLATWDVQDELQAEDVDNRVQLLTIHAAKGLEWPLVIVAGCNEGILPSKQSLDNGEIEEERRLMYVAMTRAENALVLAVRPEGEASRFIGEYYEAI